MELEIFKYENKTIRTKVINDEVYFVGKDVADILGYKDTSDALKRHVDEDDKGVGEIPTPGGNQNMYIINESGLYSLILSSKLDGAKKFKKWVTSEVLPSIRKHGMYATDELLNNPDLFIKVLKELKNERQEKEKLKNKVEIDKPKVVFAEALETSKSSILVGELAKLLKQNSINIGAKKLFSWLREKGYLGKRGESYNLPTQKSMELKIMEIKKVNIVNPDGSIRTTSTPKITGKGQLYFVNKFIARKENVKYE